MTVGVAVAVELEVRVAVGVPVAVLVPVAVGVGVMTVTAPGDGLQGIAPSLRSQRVIDRALDPNAWLRIGRVNRSPSPFNPCGQAMPMFTTPGV